MAGLRPDPIPAARLAAVAKAGAPRGAGGYLPASRRTATQTEHTPGRVLRPNPPAPIGGGGGLYIPEFTANGPIAVTYYEDANLENITGADRTILKVHARAGTPPSGGPLVCQVVLDDFSTVGEVTIPDGSLSASTTVSVTWPAGLHLTVNVSEANGAVGLVVQVLTA